VTRDAVGSGLVHLFDRESDDGLLDAVIEAIDRSDQRGVASDDYRDRYDPRAIAGQFAEEVRSRLGDSPTDPSAETA